MIHQQKMPSMGVSATCSCILGWRLYTYIYPNCHTVFCLLIYVSISICLQDPSEGVKKQQLNHFHVHVNPSPEVIGHDKDLNLPVWTTILQRVQLTPPNHSPNPKRRYLDQQGSFNQHLVYKHIS